jgi:5-methylcytosine-specific restriction endonuclease McrA
MSRRSKRTGPGLKCYWCRRELQSKQAVSLTAATRDHVVPEHTGGRHTVWACWACNNLKGAMQPLEWRAFMEAHPEWWRLAKGRRSRS